MLNIFSRTCCPSEPDQGQSFSDYLFWLSIMPDQIPYSEYHRLAKAVSFLCSGKDDLLIPKERKELLLALSRIPSDECMELCVLARNLIHYELCGADRVIDNLLLIDRTERSDLTQMMGGLYHEFLSTTSRAHVLLEVIRLPKQERREIVELTAQFVTPETSYYNLLKILSAVAETPKENRFRVTERASSLLGPYASARDCIETIEALGELDHSLQVQGFELMSQLAKKSICVVDLLELLRSICLFKPDGQSKLAGCLDLLNLQNLSSSSSLTLIRSLTVLDSELLTSTSRYIQELRSLGFDQESIVYLVLGVLKIPGEFYETYFRLTQELVSVEGSELEADRVVTLLVRHLASFEFLSLNDQNREYLELVKERSFTCPISHDEISLGSKPLILVPTHELVGQDSDRHVFIDGNSYTPYDQLALLSWYARLERLLDPKSNTEFKPGAKHLMTHPSMY